MIPSALMEYLESLVGAENIRDIQESYYRIKYEKSDEEMRLIRDANTIANAMMRAMLAVSSNPACWRRRWLPGAIWWAESWAPRRWDGMSW
ncbi:MAG: hypothetical protein ACRD1R_08510 [Acidobacteriota bacterium]